MSLLSKNFLFVLFLIFTLDLLWLTPIQWVQDIFLAYFSVLGFLFLFGQKSKNNVSNHYFKYLLVFTGLGIISILTSSYFLGQDFVSGIIGLKSFLMILSGFYFLRLYHRDEIDLERIFNAILTFAWLYFIYLFIIAYLDIHFTYTSPISNNIIEISHNKASKYLIVLGGIIYFAKFLSNKKLKFLIWGLILYSANHFSDIQRGSLLIYSLILLIGLIKFGSSKTNIKIFALIPIGTLAVLLIFMVKASSFDSINEKFSQVILLFENPDDISDPSVFIRLREIDFALNHFYESPLIGKGLLRASFLTDLFEDQYFYYGDVGIFSVLFTFGIIGILVILFQIRSLVQLINKSKPIKNDWVIIALYLYLIFLIVLSIQKGVNIFTPLQFILFISLLEIRIRKSRQLIIQFENFH